MLSLVEESVNYLFPLFIGAKICWEHDHVVQCKNSYLFGEGNCDFGMHSLIVHNHMNTITNKSARLELCNKITKGFNHLGYSRYLYKKHCPLINWHLNNGYK